VNLHHYESALDTLPKLLRSKAQRYGDSRIAMRVKDRGIWKPITWKTYFESVRDLCLGMVKLGLKRGDKVSIIGENKPEWFTAEMAAQCAGAVAVGIFTDCTPPEVKYFIEQSDSKFLVAHDQEQVDKILEIREALPLLKKIIYWDPKGLWNYKDPDLLSMEEVMEAGRHQGQKYPGLFDEMIDQGTARDEDIVVICYTSGTTGEPKAAMLSSKYLVDMNREWSKRDGWDQEGLQYVSFISLSWGAEQNLGLSGNLAADVCVNFPEEAETVQENIREIAPELLFFGARLWENINRTVQARMMDSTRLRRWIYNRCLHVGLMIADKKIEKGSVSLWLRFLGWLIHQAVFRALKERLGLSRLKVAYSAGGALSPDIIRFFLAIGVEIRLFYGATEIGILTSPLKGEIHPETSGKPMPWVEIKISENGEILARSKYGYSGYYKEPDATARKIKDGFYCTGDFGYINEEGHLIVIDRMDDLKPLAGGRKFSPQYTETRLRFSPYIKDLMVVGGEQRDFVTGIIDIDFDNASRFAEARNIPYTTFADLSQKPQIINLILQEIRKINRTLPEHARVQRFVNLPKPFDVDEAELTRTRKLRRSYVEDRYRYLIEGLYSNQEEIAVETTVTYRDGREAVLRNSIQIINVN